MSLRLPLIVTRSLSSSVIRCQIGRRTSGRPEEVLGAAPQPIRPPISVICHLIPAIVIVFPQQRLRLGSFIIQCHQLFVFDFCAKSQRQLHERTVTATGPPSDTLPEGHISRRQPEAGVLGSPRRSSWEVSPDGVHPQETTQGPPPPRGARPRETDTEVFRL